MQMSCGYHGSESRWTQLGLSGDGNAAAGGRQMWLQE